MEGLLSVSVGTVFWASIAFIAVLVLLKKMAWGPIMQTLKEREEGIADALRKADAAKEEMSKLQASNEDLLREARNDRDRIMSEAKAMADQMRSEAVGKAQKEASAIIAKAQVEIETQKQAAISELKNQVADLSIQLAESLLKNALTDAEKQQALNSALINEFGKN
ncbi:MAG: F0F1 ATP synthase subunit B [Bacteroidetes bacterium]|nr:F0F1 ATP synthase subunit B [Bacteroidota bacterium]